LVLRRWSLGCAALGDEAQRLPDGTAVGVGLHVVGEILRAEHPWPRTDRRQWDICADVLPLDGGDILDGGVLGVASHLARSQLPAEARSPKQVEGRLVFLDLGWRGQG
jgi:hypothetical protein